MEERRRETVRDGWKQGSEPREREAAKSYDEHGLGRHVEEGREKGRKTGGREYGGRKENSQEDVVKDAEECVQGGIIPLLSNDYSKIWSYFLMVMVIRVL